MRETIQFKKQRELGTILSDIFKFIRLNWKPLFTMILRTAGPALLVLLIAYIYYMRAVLGGAGIFNINSFEGLGTNAFLALLVLLVAGTLYYSLLNGVIMHYIKSYIKNDGTVIQEEVSEGVKADFWKLVGTSLLVGIIVGFGMLLCVIPGIYFGVVLSTAYAIVIFERKDVTDAISHCFALIKNEWWMTFATFFVMFLLFYLIMFIFQIPQYIYFFIKGFVASEEITADPAALFDWVYLVLTALSTTVQYLMYTLIILCSAFVYFHLNEKKYFTGTMETIESLGKKE